ncbi:MAG: TonB-dependent receptor, partial [Candidatus Kapabacteria bacterium]|nr:TonB-dependent receptor [Candidatus Kapabacteria bacterium]
PMGGAGGDLPERGHYRRFRLPATTAVRISMVGGQNAVAVGLLGSTIAVWAQLSVLTGRVVEAPGGQPLAGATVRVEGTVLGAVTTRTGAFTLRGIPPGEYTLVVSMVGYRHFRQLVRLRGGDTIRLTVALEPQPVGFGEVVVTAAKRAQTLQEAPVSIATVEARSFQERSFTRLDEVLRTVSGVVINRDQVSIRGSSGFAFGVGSRTLLLVDGIPLLSGDGGELKYDVLPLLSVERVEVLKGAASALYGTAALGGVVNVMTAEPLEGSTFRFRTYGGTYTPPRFASWDIGPRGIWGADFLYTGRHGPVGVVLSTAGVRDEGYRRDSDSRRWQALAKARWTLSAVSVLTLLGYYTGSESGNWIYWKSLREATRPGNPDSSQRVRSGKAVLAAQWQQVWRADLSSTLRVGLYRTDFANRHPAVGSDTGLPQSLAHSLSAEWQWTKELQPRVLLTAGLHGIANIVESELYGNRRQAVGALYGQLELGAQRSIGLTAGIRTDWERTYGAARQHIELSPRIGLTYASWFGPQFRATLGRAFRAPTVAERFATVRAAGFVVQPNPELKPERAWTAEVGVMDTLRLSIGKWPSLLFVDVALFQSEYYDLIEPQLGDVGGEVAVQFLNLTRARVQGAECVVRMWLGPRTRWSAGGLLGVESGLTLLNPRDLSRNDWLRYRSRRLWYTRWTLPLPLGEVQLEYRYHSHVDRIDDELVTLGLIRNADARVPIHVVDVHLTVVGARAIGLPVTLTVNLRNALDYYYTEVPGNLALPRQFVLQLSGQW